MASKKSPSSNSTKSSSQLENKMNSPYQDKTSTDLAKQLGARSIGQKLLMLTEHEHDGRVVNDAIIFGKNEKSYLIVDLLRSCGVSEFSVPDDKYIEMSELPTVAFFKNNKYLSSGRTVPAILDKLEIDTINELADDENKFIIENLVKALSFVPKENITLDRPKTAAIKYAIDVISAKIINADGIMRKIVISPLLLPEFWKLGREFFDEATIREMVCDDLYGHLNTADLHVSKYLDVNTILITGSPDKLGEYVVKKTELSGPIYNRNLSQDINIVLKDLNMLHVIYLKD